MPDLRRMRTLRAAQKTMHLRRQYDDKFRKQVYLAHEDGHSYRAIGEFLGIAHGHVHTLAQSGKELMKP